MRRSVLVLGIAFLFASPMRLPADGPPKSVESLEKEIADLKARLNQLAEQLEGTAKPLNLGRTSLAAVSASTVNGGRDLANQYYGIRNAFDDGDNWINGINYTWWLSSGGESQWIEIHFDVPVTVARIQIDSRSAFATRLSFAKGSEEDHGRVVKQLDFKKLVGGVKRVRLSLSDTGNIRIDEIRVLGFVPPGTKYTPGKPRILATQQNTLDIARAAFQEWAMQLFRAATHRAQEDATSYTVTFRQAGTGIELFRVTMDKATSQLRMEPLALPPTPKAAPRVGPRR